ncbi:MAG: NAD(P)-dependent glycerol-3-phosphate dehydrogenase [Armatimonadetes bacterium]|nr:NAD(P)-dependent glycerol-3-phosphate dehydrogenase [Armatimonadota bacterium]
MIESGAPVAILGAGSWGSALATVLQHPGPLRLWARDPELVFAIERRRENERYLPGIRLPDRLTALSDLDDALREAPVVVFAVPSAGMGEVADLAAPLVRPDALIVNASKGLEETSGLRMSEIIGRACGRPDLDRIVTLSGPNLAREVARGLPTATVAASSSHEAAEQCRDLWMGPTFRVYTSLDIVGVELAGAMKNVIAIGAGVCEGMGFGDNSRAALMTRGLAEITRLGTALGAEQSTFLGLAGVGDLIATGGSRLSRNYRVGVGLGAGKTLDAVLAEIGQVAEGVPTTRALCRLAERVGADMPVSRAIYAVLFEDAPVGDTIGALMRRPPRDEG